MADYHILYVDDEPATESIQDAIGAEFKLVECNNEARYKDFIQRDDCVFHGAVVDHRLLRPHFTSFDNGLVVTKHLRSRFPHIAIVAFSAYLQPGSEISEISKWLVAGANFFWHRSHDPFRPSVVEQVRHVLLAGAQRVEDVNRIIASKVDLREYPQLSKALSKLDRIAILPSAVLINGETGTGKELVARTIHDRSPRRSNPFVAVNCAALPAELLESELFGYEKGAFTGAKAAKKGLFEAADGGTIFLDEIGELRVDLQAKLLRVLQERSFIKIGGTKETKVDVRLIAATHRNLPQRIKEGHFREDLYYRLNAFQIYVPPLRERLEDISVLARNLTKRWSTIFGTQIELDDDVVGYLKTYDYPGNVREFENVIQRIVGLVSAQHPTVDEIKAIEAFPFCPSVDELLHETSMERKPVRHSCNSPY